jgi:TPR repeat protein
MRRRYGVPACVVVLLAMVGASATAGDLTKPALTYEQSEDRSNFIAMVRKARLGDAEMQWQVGSTYVKLGDPERAFPMLKTAAEAGRPPAATLLGWLYEGGRGTAKSAEDAMRWYRFAAEQGQPDAMAALGRLHLQVPGGRDAALQWLRQAARMGSADGQYLLGWLLAEGAARADDEQAFAWFVKAAHQGHLGAQIATATHLLSGRGVAADRHAAAEWLMRAAETRDPVAHFLLGRLREGDGEKHADQVINPFRIAAEAGHREAQFALAVVLAKSSVGTDKSMAVEWLAKAHEAGHKAAANRLGEMYRDGVGVSRQLVRARKLFQEAAETGNVNAMYNLARMEYDGLGGQRDTGKALDWYTRAADEGHEEASAVVESLLDSSVKTSSLGLKGFWQQ